MPHPYNFGEPVKLHPERDEGFTGPVDPSWEVSDDELEKDEEDKTIYE